MRGTPVLDVNLTERHPSTVHIAQFFTDTHLPPHLREISGPCADLAAYMIRALPDGPELTDGLRLLLQAKDSFVRQAVAEGTRP
ncbi:hypothetical protein ACIBF5_09520 [Micromonospora sp. NPDC050417]|uniref:hypothetical protein n=1 Tax=Micromonospora sp. NPDC050417 TaxID=3364280 RepID=UPI0037BC10B6